MRRGGVPPRCSWCGRTEYPPANQGRGQRAGTFVLLMRFSERQTDAPMHGGPIPKDSGGRRSPQILPRIGGMPEDRADDRASVALAAVAAGRKPLFRYAFADPAQVAAIGKFHSLRAAARTMDGRGRDLRCIVHFAPFPGGALPKGVVVVDGSPAGVAVFAIQAAAGNQSFHHFCSFSAPPLFVTSPAVRGVRAKTPESFLLRGGAREAPAAVSGRRAGSGSRVARKQGFRPRRRLFGMRTGARLRSGYCGMKM